MHFWNDHRPGMKYVDVAIGIVLRYGKVLICQRRAQGTLAGLWEFPGGKQGRAEKIEQTLARELREELAIEVRMIEALPPIEFDYSSALVRLHPFLCEHVAGEPQPLASQSVQWVLPSDLPTYHFPPANDPLIKDLIRRFSSPPP